MDEAKRWRAEGQLGGDQTENRTSTQRINSRSSQKKEKKINQAADAVQGKSIQQLQEEVRLRSPLPPTQRRPSNFAWLIRMEVHVKQDIPACRRHRETGREK